MDLAVVGEVNVASGPVYDHSQSRRSCHREVRAEMTYHAVYYAIIKDGDDGVVLQGVYFGGLGQTVDEANTIARHCVNSIPGTILPRIVPLTGECQLIDAMDSVIDRFESLVAHMREVESAMSRKKK